MREANFTRDGDRLHFGDPNVEFEKVTLQQCWDECRRKAGYDRRRAEAEEFNKNSPAVKKGVAMVPMKFATTMGVGMLHQARFLSNVSRTKRIIFLVFSQAHALVQVYLDGSVLLSHGGIEMGQGLNTKMCQVASRCLGVPAERVHIAETSTATVPNATPTGGSTGADLNGPAVMDGCTTIR